MEDLGLAEADPSILEYQALPTGTPPVNGEPDSAPASGTHPPSCSIRPAPLGVRTSADDPWLMVSTAQLKLNALM